MKNDDESVDATLEYFLFVHIIKWYKKLVPARRANDDDDD